MLMGSQIDELIEKYWRGDTSLEEEQTIKLHFGQNPSLTNDGNYFRYLTKQKEMTFKESKPESKFKKTWLSAAVTVTIGLITAILVFNDANKDPFAEEDPEKAFQVTRQALMMIGAGLNEGQSHTMELSKFNKAKEELQEKEKSEAL